jgi:hypothetical protein
MCAASEGSFTADISRTVHAAGTTDRRESRAALGRDLRPDLDATDSLLDQPLYNIGREWFVERDDAVDWIVVVEHILDLAYRPGPTLDRSGRHRRRLIQLSDVGNHAGFLPRRKITDGSSKNASQ